MKYVSLHKRYLPLLKSTFYVPFTWLMIEKIYYWTPVIEPWPHYFRVGGGGGKAGYRKTRAESTCRRIHPPLSLSHAIPYSNWQEFDGLAVAYAWCISPRKIHRGREREGLAHNYGQFEWRSIRHVFSVYPDVSFISNKMDSFPRQIRL